MHKQESPARFVALQFSIILALFLIVISPAQAQERVENLTTEIQLSSNGKASVRHNIIVFAEGVEIKRGIYFELPGGIGRITNFTVLRDGVAEPFNVDGRDIRIGKADVFIEHGRHDYEIVYDAAAPFVEGADGAVTVSWQPLINQFELPWSEARFALSWPEGNAPIGIDAPGAVTTESGLSWISTNAEGVPERVEIKWAADAFPAESVRPRPYNPMLRYGAILAALGVFFYFHTQWQAHGKDLPGGAATPRSQAPRGISAGAARFISRMSYDAPCFVAALASLAVKGAVTISLEKKTKLQINKLSDNETGLSRGEIALVRALFAKGAPAFLSPSNSLVAKGMKAHQKALRAEFGERFFTDNKKIWGRGFTGALLVMAVLAVAMIAEATSVSTDFVAVLLGLGAVMFLFMTPLIYYALMRAPTVAGRVIMDELDGLRLFLSDEAPLPSVSGKQFVELLPFAIALDVEKEWAARFGDALPSAEDEAAQAVIDWYDAMRRQNDGATLVAVIIPAVAASTSGGSAGAGAGGASAGGW